MKNREFTRTISIIFAVVFFILAIAMSIAMVRTIVGVEQSDRSAFFKWTYAVLSTYKFSSLLIPLSLLYAAITLLTPGWSRHSRAILLSLPLVFVSCAVGEYAIGVILPKLQNPTIVSFAKWTIFLLIALVICMISLVSHIASDKLFKNTNQVKIFADVDIVGDDYKGGEKEDEIYLSKREVKAEGESFFSLFKVEEHKGKAHPIFIPSIKESSIWEEENEEKESEEEENKEKNEEENKEIELKDKKTELQKDKKMPDRKEVQFAQVQAMAEETGENIAEKEEYIEEQEEKNEKIVEKEVHAEEMYTEEMQGKRPEKEQKIEDVQEGRNPEFKVAEIEVKECITEESAGCEKNISEIQNETEEINTLEVVSVKPAVAPQIQEIRKGYHIPFELLTDYPGNEYWIIDSATRKAAFILKSTLNEFKINVDITGIRKGPVVTMFEVLPPPGIKLAKITALQDNIALRLAAESVRIVAPIPGKRAVGIEIPNVERSIVGFRELIQAEHKDKEKMAIPIVLGKDITGEPEMIDLAQTPHLLIAGATGAGKSVCVNSIILSILYNNRPDEVKLMLIDPKIVELKLYNDIAHLLTPVITEPKKAFQALQYCICEMERRYSFLDRISVRDIKSYNKKIKSEHLAMERLPYIVIIIDEFADLMATTGKELEGTVSRLCAMSRAVGIHLVLATQRPSADVITGLIKANIPSRIAFMVASRIDSRIILDDGGAEKLLGKGDMLYVSPARPWPTRIQGAYLSEDEVVRVVEEVKTFGEPDYIDDEIFMDDEEEQIDSFFGEESDPLYDEALNIVLSEGKASASYIQRRLKIGYNRAARIIDEMERRGVVGPANGAKPREIL